MLRFNRLYLRPPPYTPQRSASYDGPSPSPLNTPASAVGSPRSPPGPYMSPGELAAVDAVADAIRTSERGGAGARGGVASTHDDDVFLDHDNTTPTLTPTTTNNNNNNNDGSSSETNNRSSSLSPIAAPSAPLPPLAEYGDDGDALKQSTMSLARDHANQTWGFSIRLSESGNHNHTIVNHVNSNTPAFGHLQKRDVIFAINGTRVADLSLEEVVDICKEPQLTLQVDIGRPLIPAVEEAERDDAGVLAVPVDAPPASPGYDDLDTNDSEDAGYDLDASDDAGFDLDGEDVPEGGGGGGGGGGQQLQRQQQQQEEDGGLSASSSVSDLSSGSYEPEEGRGGGQQQQLLLQRQQQEEDADLSLSSSISSASSSSAPSPPPSMPEDQGGDLPHRQAETLSVTSPMQDSDSDSDEKRVEEKGEEEAPQKPHRRVAKTARSALTTDNSDPLGLGRVHHIISVFSDGGTAPFYLARNNAGEIASIVHVDADAYISDGASDEAETAKQDSEMLRAGDNLLALNHSSVVGMEGDEALENADASGKYQASWRNRGREREREREGGLGGQSIFFSSGSNAPALFS